MAHRDLEERLCPECGVNWIGPDEAYCPKCEKELEAWAYKRNYIADHGFTHWQWLDVAEPRADRPPCGLVRGCRECPYDIADQGPDAGSDRVR